MDAPPSAWTSRRHGACGVSRDYRDVCELQSWRTTKKCATPEAKLGRLERGRRIQGDWMRMTLPDGSSRDECDTPTRSSSRVVKRAYKYRFYPTAEQADQLNRTFGCVRYVYNRATL